MKHLHLFQTDDEFKTAYVFSYAKPWVSYTKENKKVNYNKTPLEPLTFNILSDGNIGWKSSNNTSASTIQYSKNGGEWTDITSTTEGATIPVVTGDVLRFKGNIWPCYNDVYSYNRFTSTCTFTISGNPGSLKYGEVTYRDEPLAKYCYYRMFSDCTGLTSVPELPATTLAVGCYSNMFSGCTSLTTAPELPATTLTNYCYSGMFYGCTSLTTAPSILPATTLAGDCYSTMFRGCTSLTTAPELPATELKNYCYDRMFKGCTSLTTATELPATELKNYCYREMFDGCSNLNYVKCLATNISASDALLNWLYNVSSTGTFYKAASVTYPSGNSGIPSGWTVVEI